MAVTNRSSCPVNLAVEILGDRWTLLILRDIVFAGRRHFRELVRCSEERITTSVLADRLERLVSAGVLRRDGDPTHRQKAVYSLTAKGIDLVPVLATVGAWGAKHCAADPDKSADARALDIPPPASWQQLMDTLRTHHVALTELAP